MGVIPFPEPEPEDSSSTPGRAGLPGLFNDVVGQVLSALVPSDMTIGGALELISEIPLRDLFVALDLMPPAKDVS